MLNLTVCLLNVSLSRDRDLDFEKPFLFCSDAEPDANTRTLECRLFKDFFNQMHWKPAQQRGNADVRTRAASDS